MGWPCVFEVDADLVFAAGVERELYQGVAVAGFERAVACHGELALVGIVGGIHFVTRVFGKIAADGAFALVEVAFDNGHICALEHHIVPVILHGGLGLLGLGKHHEAGGLLVETVHDKYFVARVDAFHVVAQQRVGRAVFFGVGCHG